MELSRYDCGSSAGGIAIFCKPEIRPIFLDWCDGTHYDWYIFHFQRVVVKAFGRFYPAYGYDRKREQKEDEK